MLIITFLHTETRRRFASTETKQCHLKAEKAIGPADRDSARIEAKGDASEQTEGHRGRDAGMSLMECSTLLCLTLFSRASA